jgi:hypothetical protein
MNAVRLGVAGATVIVTGGLLAKYFSYSEELRPLQEQWLSLAILAASVGIAASLWFRRNP